MKHILSLTDFSQTAENAFVYKLSMAKSIAADVHIARIVNVIPPKDEKEAFTIHPVEEMINQRTEQIECGRFHREAALLGNIAKIINWKR